MCRHNIPAAMSEVVSALVTVAASSLSSVLTGTRASGFSLTGDDLQLIQKYLLSLVKAVLISHSRISTPQSGRMPYSFLLQETPLFASTYK